MTAVKDLRTLTKNLDSNGNETANVYITGTATENPWTTLSTGASEVTDWKNLPVSKADDNKTTITKVWEGAGQDSAKFYIYRYVPVQWDGSYEGTQPEGTYAFYDEITVSGSGSIELPTISYADMNDEYTLTIPTYVCYIYECDPADGYETTYKDADGVDLTTQDLSFWPNQAVLNINSDGQIVEDGTGTQITAYPLTSISDANWIVTAMNDAVVTNSKIYTLPYTGGVGSGIFIPAGVACILTAGFGVAVYSIRRRRVFATFQPPHPAAPRPRRHRDR